MNNTIKIFKELSKIPRPSGKEEKVKDFLIKFAKENNLEYIEDKSYNVIIKKKSNKTNCNKTLILQAHSDMVCEKNNDTDFDFDTMNINLVEDGDFLHAKGTTLGADNGIGLSMILSVLSDDTLKIPNLECIFTTQEETTMQGAIDLDFKNIKGNHLLSIDGTDEGKIEVSSAGMVVANLSKKYKLEKIDKSNLYEITISGLKGGHSGTEINTNRENAIKILFDILSNYKKKLQILSLYGGGKSNAIPRECTCIISTNESYNNLLNVANNTVDKYKNNEPNISTQITVINANDKLCLNNEDSKSLIEFINNYKNGVLVYSKNKPNFPISSCNLANISLKNENLNIIVSLRSSLKTQEKEYLNKLFNLADNYNLQNKVLSTAPFFEKKENSYLQELCKNSYKELFNVEAQIEGVHAGLEGGVFANKKEDIDICVIAPNIYDAHSPQERVSISSINRVYKWLEKIVENF